MLVIARLLATLVVAAVWIVQALTGLPPLGVAVVGASVAGSLISWHLIERYWKRERGLRFGPFGMSVASVFTWIVVSGICLLLLYFPTALWVS